MKMRLDPYPWAFKYLRWDTGRPKPRVLAKNMWRTYISPPGPVQQPWCLVAGITDRCNADCVFCARRFLPHKPLDMPLDMFKDTVDALPTVRYSILTGWGEPLMNRKLEDAVQYATNKGIGTKVYTNASLLTEKRARGLFEAGLGELVFSIDECTPAAYEALRKNMSFKVVERNVKAARVVRDQGRYGTVMRHQVVKGPENSPNIDKIVGYWKPFADITTVKPEFAYRSYAKPDPLFDSGSRLYCQRPYEHATVWATGEMVLCCCDINHYAVGKVQEKDPMELFNCEKFQSIRRGMAKGDKVPVMCRKCLGGPGSRRDEA